MNYTDHQTSTVAQRLSELYVNYKNNFIEQCPDGSYRSYIDKGTFLGVGFLEHHLEGKRTFGIREEKASKVAIFDIDEDNREAVKAIISILTELGIWENRLNSS